LTRAAGRPYQCERPDNEEESVQDWEVKLSEQRVAKLVAALESLLYTAKVPFELRFKVSDKQIPFAEKDKGLVPIRKGETWGRTWQSAWFHARATVPGDWKGRHVVAVINFSGEACVFDADGTPIGGLTGVSVHRNDYSRERYQLLRSAKGGEKIDLWIEASASGLFGVVLNKEPDPDDPERFGIFDAVVKDASLALFREDIWHLWLDCRVLADQMSMLPARSVRRARILRALCDVADKYYPDDPSPESTAAARQRLAAVLSLPATGSSLTTRAVGHAHIDTAWLWPLSETIRKCGRTFSTQIALTERYPGYVFGASQPQLYQFTKDHYPKLYEKVKKAVREGRWELQGAMWIEADANLTSGEAMVRQILHGKNFYLDEFGVEVRNLWLPDVFGYSAAMPQILRKAGIDVFLTQKISWSQFNKFPHHSFNWIGIDGTEILVHFPPEDTYNSMMTAAGLVKAAENFIERDTLDEFMTLFGVGDGGGGPTEENIEMGLRQRDLEGAPKVTFGPAQEMLDRLAAQKAGLAEWVGELYLELHRGTLTTQARNKRMNRKMELRLRDVEVLWSCLPVTRYPAAEMDRLWKLVLLNQFHDIIPGSSIHQVYIDSQEQYRDVDRSSAALVQQAASALFAADKEAVTLVNTTGVANGDPVRLPEGWAGHAVTDGAGKPVAVQAEGDAAWVAADLPARGVRTLRRGAAAGAAAAAPARKGDGWVLENELVRCTFDASGVLASVFDKEAGREALEKPAELQIYEDNPCNWEAWDVDIYYQDQLREVLKPTACESFGGVVRQGLRLTYRFGRSTIAQEITLAAGSRRLDFATKADWHERRKILRVAFATGMVNASARFDIQFGTLERPGHRNTSWDRARFEVAAHRFADLSSGGWGVALLNDCKYGYKVVNGELSLSLLRSPVHPDADADQGSHLFTYSLLPHPGDLRDSCVYAEAARLNQPPLVLAGVAAKAAELPLPVKIEGQGVVFEVLKKAERGTSWILRVWECRGCPTTARLSVAGGARCHEVDLMERDSGEVALASGAAEVAIKPFEIRTFRITPRA
jgi:alpha-mannosidase